MIKKACGEKINQGQKWGKGASIFAQNLCTAYVP